LNRNWTWSIVWWFFIKKITFCFDQKSKMATDAALSFSVWLFEQMMICFFLKNWKLNWTQTVHEFDNHWMVPYKKFLFLFFYQKSKTLNYFFSETSQSLKSKLGPYGPLQNVRFFFFCVDLKSIMAATAVKSFSKEPHEKVEWVIFRRK
jgi:hypothetical protein